MKVLGYVPALLLAVGLSACETLTVPDLNNPGLDELSQDPTRAAVVAAAQGLFQTTRLDIADRASQITMLGIVGRESYNFDGSDPGFTAEMLVGPLDGGSPAFGGNQWTQRYRSVRGADNVVRAVDQLADVVMPAAERAGIRGFARTLMALDLLLLIDSRDENGITTSVNPDPTGDPTPWSTKDQAFTTIGQMLDDAATDLGSAGGAFAADFRFTAGYSGFDDPAGFLEFNRALRARVAVYTGDFALALSLLDGGDTFLDAGGSLGIGVYYNYGIGSGEVQNLLFDQSNVLLAHPSIETDAQLQASGDRDLRYLTKVTRLPSPIPDQASQGISSDLDFIIYSSPTASVPIIRNEELILLRAEANLGCTGDASGVTCSGNADAALPDINLIRQTAGGLDPIALGDWQALTAEQQLDELLYHKRYSLLWEGGHRWVDMRRYGKLDELPLDMPNFFVADRFPVPTPECDARRDNPPPSC